MQTRCLNCHAVGPWGRQGRCPKHRAQTQRPRDRQRDQQPNRRNQKTKYNQAHRNLRTQWTPHVNTGTVACWRCGNPITPDTRWHLGHRPHQPSHPEHAACNLTNSNENRKPQ